MSVFSLKLVGFMVIAHLVTLQRLTGNDDQDQIFSPNEKPICGQNDIQKFKTSFNISSTKGLERVCEVDIDSVTGKMIKQYFENTNPHEFDISITNIFSIRRKYEQDIFAQWTSKSDFNNKELLLLWHGTKMDLLQGIIDNGLQAPDYEEQLAKGGSAFVMIMQQMFGSGIFFADRSSKSAQYTGTRKGFGVILLCEVALGQSLKAWDAHDFSQALRGIPDSVMGIGKVIPDANGTYMFEHAYVHAGATLSGRTSGGPGSLAHPYHNEYIVFDPTRIHIKYIIRIKFN